MNSKNYICKKLKETKRDGIDELIEYMEDCDFFTAPCSSQYHLCKEGGLAEHTVNVIKYAEKLANILDYNDKNAIIISAALHDLGKIGQFNKPLYVENVLKSGKVSDSKPYTSNKDLLPVDHEIRSISMAQMFIDLSEEEQFAILYHNGLYGTVGKYSLSGHETPLQMIIHWADLWCSRVVEDE